MADPRQDRIWALFEAALEAEDAAARDRVLEESGADPDVMAEVRSLLDAHHREGGILDAVVDGDGKTDLQAVLARALSDRYRIVEELGRGGMARVFLAWEQKHDRRVVLKVLLPAMAVLHGTERFRREIDLVARLSHPNIVSLIDSGVVEGLIYYVMPFVEGETLRAHLDATEGRRLPLPRVLTILGDVASGLEHAHAMGVVHRDLKPDNILLAGTHAYLLDFGVARALEPTSGGEADPALTRVGDFVGTPRYAAPEQGAAFLQVDHRADLWAWGVLAHELLTGTLPAPQGEPGAELVGGIAAEIRSRRPETPEWLAALVEQCLAPDPRQRPQGAGEVLEVLAPHLETPPARESARPRRLSPWLYPTLVAAAVAGVWFAVSGRGGMDGVGAVPMPVAVAPFQNQTTDPSMDVVGRFAGDWITQGLLELERVRVVPWPASLQASSRQDGGGGVVQALARETGAGTVVTGSFYEMGGQLQFRVEIVDARTGVVLVAPPPISVPRDSSEAAIREMRERVNGSLAVATDSRLAAIPGMVLHPPTFEAYRAFDRGMERYLLQDYRAASTHFLEAWERDTTFVSTLVYAASTLMNTGEPVRADSVVDLLAARRDALSSLDEQRMQHLRARLDGDGVAQLRALRAAFALAPGSRAGYNLAQTANDMNRPREAVRVLEGLDPDRGELRGWAQYWTQLAHGRHLLGLHEEEAQAAREMRNRHPERRIALVLEVRARAAQGNVEAVRELISQGFTLAPDTYWSVGAAMVVAAEELRAHGHEGWEPWLDGAERWLAQRLQQSDQNGHRYWLASVHYDRRDWATAREHFLQLRERSPNSDTYRGMAALAAAHLGDLDTARAELEAPFPFDPGEHSGYLARLAGISGDADRTVALLSQALQHAFGGFPWVHASGYDDLQGVLADPRVSRVMAPLD